MVENERFAYIAELRDSGHLEESIREAKASLAGINDDEKAALLTGILVCYLRLGQPQDAERILAEMVKLEPSELEIRLNVEFCAAAFHIDENNYKQGTDAFARLLEHHGAALRQAKFTYLYEDIQSRRAEALVWQSRYAEALPILREAVSFQYDEPWFAQRIRYYFGLCLELTGDPAEARIEFGRVVACGLKTAIERRALWRLAVLNFNSGLLVPAKDRMEQLLRDYPPDHADEPAVRQVHELLARTFHFLGDKAKEAQYADLAQRG